VVHLYYGLDFEIEKGTFRREVSVQLEKVLLFRRQVVMELRIGKKKKLDLFIDRLPASSGK
jgi:hypothetical protein